MKKLPFNLDLSRMDGSHFIAKYINEMMQCSGGYIEYKFACAIVCLAIATSRKVYMKFNFNRRTKMYLNLWVQLLGESSSAGKSTSINDEAAELLSDSINTKFLPDLFSKEALVQELSEDGNQQMFNDEVSGLIMDMAAKGSYLRSLDKDMCKWFACPNHTTRTLMKKRFDMYNLFINCLFATTPDSFVDNIPKEMLTGGFYARMLIIIPKGDPVDLPTSQPDDDDCGGGIDDELANHLRYIKFFVNQFNLIRFRLTDEGLDIYNKWWSSITTTGMGRAKDMILHRQRIYLFKIASILYIGSQDFLDDSMKIANDGEKNNHSSHPWGNASTQELRNISMTIPDKYVILARDWINEYFMPVAINIFNEVEFNSNKGIAGILRALKNAENHKLKKSDLYRNGNFSSVQQFNDTLFMLYDEGYIDIVVDEVKAKNGKNTTWCKLIHD